MWASVSWIIMLSKTSFSSSMLLFAFPILSTLLSTAECPGSRNLYIWFVSSLCFRQFCDTFQYIFLNSTCFKGLSEAEEFIPSDNCFGFVVLDSFLNLILTYFFYFFREVVEEDLTVKLKVVGWREDPNKPEEDNNSLKVTEV